MKVAVLGANGMLGSVVARFLLESGFDVHGFTRADFDATDVFQKELNIYLEGFSWVINCIGIIKPRINEECPEEAILVNSLFPYKLSKVPGVKVIQIATDCVYSGMDHELLDESHRHDPRDVYGMTKSLGEVVGGNFYNIRCSIIGPKKGNKSLMQWVLDQPEGAQINGYVNHLWNGITTLAFAKICLAIMQSDDYPLIDQHVIPLDHATKDDLLKMMADIYERPDLEITAIIAPQYCNRILGTVHESMNETLWAKAGYKGVPSIRELLIEMKQWQGANNGE